MGIDRRIIVDNVCGWPNLTRMPDGSLISAMFNKPSHLRIEGELDCYISRDEGETWQYLSRPFPPEERIARANHSCGLSASGDFIIICGGWDKRPKPNETLPPWVECNRIPSVMGRSSDGGKTFFRSDFGYSIKNLPIETERLLGTYGDIVRVGNRLACAAYSCSKDQWFTRAFIVFSEDDGKTWSSHSIISENNHHETALLFFDERRGIAISRENIQNRLDQYNTDDGGQTWSFAGTVTGPGIHPGHLVQLTDGSVILTAGIRFKNAYGIGAVISRDKGTTWSRMTELASFPEATDGGYPSTVQLGDGRLLTHYYSNKAPLHDRYYVGQIIWDLSEFEGC